MAGREVRVLNVAGNRNPAGTSVMFDATVELLAVIFTELDALDLTVQPVATPAPPHGANIEFVVPAASRTPQGPALVREGVGAIRMRVFERGVGETLSCGTGTAAGT